MNIDISNLAKAEVLTKLFNSAVPGGRGFLQNYQEPMTVKEAQELLDSGQTYFSYLKGRTLKIDFVTDFINVTQYDTYNGKGAAIKALAADNAQLPHTKSSVFDKACEVISSQFGVPVSQINAAQNLVDDLGADSLDKMELLMLLEDKFDLQLDDNIIKEWNIVEDVYNCIFQATTN